MTVDGIQRVTVLGAGNMGHGIAEVTAIAGYDVTLRDIEREYVEKGHGQIQWSLEKLESKGKLDESAADILDRIDLAVDIEKAVAEADLVIEAAPERLSIKEDIFTDLTEYAPADAILATNTSSLSITQIAKVVDNPSRVVGLHFFNPPVKMPLVEVIYGEETSEDTATAAADFVESIDKTPIYVRKDVNGFVVNSVLGPFLDEPAWMVSEDAGTVRDIDATMVYERGYPMGPFELSDMTGIDISHSVREEAGKPIAPAMQERVDAEEYGRKSGKGWYDYENGGADYTEDDVSGDVDTLRIEARMINEAAKLVDQAVSIPNEIDTGMKLGAGFPEGPCARADEIGLDVVLDSLRDHYERTDADRFEPSPYLVSLVEDGKTGKAAGEGFYTYD